MLHHSTPLSLRAGLCALLGWLCLSTVAQAVPGPSKQTPWHYTLLEGSELIDDCPICGRPTILAPVRGSFSLQLLEENPLFAIYRVSDVEFVGGTGAGPAYRITGDGTFRIGGEVAVVQEMFLDVKIDNGFKVTEARLTSPLGLVPRRWPMLRVELNQTNGTPGQVYDLSLAAAPLREIWFSTAYRFHSGVSSAPVNSISDGDVLSSTGRIVRRQRELTRGLGIMPVVPDVGLDGLDLRAGGEIAFTIEQDIFSERLGPLQHGDLLSDRGRILTKNQALLAAFGSTTSAPDAGLDAVHELTDAATDPKDIWFSIEKEAFSERLGRLLRPGDVLSSQGRVVRSNQELLARFRPRDPGVDHGLDALYVWPSGEIWFSTETEFVAGNLQAYGSGDLLSDEGYVVMRNLELLRPYAPMEDITNFGLDAVWIVTDAVAPWPAPRITTIQANPTTGTVTLRWEGAGRVFQVQGAERLTGPYLPLGPIAPDLEFQDVGALRQSSARFYRLGQW